MPARLSLEGWDFVWDPDKAAANLKKHGVSFPDAATSFLDPLGLFLPDVHHPGNEILIAETTSAKLLFTVFVQIDTTERLIRIISARRATAHERKGYEQR